MTDNRQSGGSFLDRALAAIAPKYAVQRKTAQIQLAILGGYEAASRGRNSSGWSAPAYSGNEALRYDLEVLRDRSRAIVRNSPYGERAITIINAKIISTGIRPRISQEYQELQALWDHFVENADYEGNTNLYGLQALAMRTTIESGEALIIKRPVKANSGLKIPLQYQVLEPDFIDSRKNESTDSGQIIQGIELDKRGRRVAYWLYDQHPGEGFNAINMESRRVDANQVIHLFEPKRAGVVRGVPWLAPVMLKLKNLDDFDDAELLAKKIQACHVIAIQSSLEDSSSNLGPITRKTDGTKVETIKAGAILRPQAGQEAKFLSPDITVGYPDYTKKHLRDIATGARVTYEELTGDLSDVNFSAHKAGSLSMRQWVEQFRSLTYIPRVCVPIWREFVAYADSIHDVEAPDSIAWSPPKWPSIDPAKEVKADRDAIRAGLKSLPEAILDAGGNPEEVFTAIKETNERLDRDGIVLDSDPRKQTQSGVSQKEENEGVNEND